MLLRKSIINNNGLSVRLNRINIIRVKFYRASKIKIISGFKFYTFSTKNKHKNTYMAEIYIFKKKIIRKILLPNIKQMFRALGVCINNIV